jgi:hypothetical protein
MAVAGTTGMRVNRRRCGYDWVMSRTARRCISWTGTLAIVAGVAIGARYLPGAGSVTDELRWLFGWPSHANLNRADALFELAEQQAPGSQTRILDALLGDSDPVVQQAGLNLSTGALLRALGTSSRKSPRQALDPFLRWLARVPPEKRLQYDPYPLLIAELPPAQRVAAGLLTPGDLRWMIAGTRERSLDWRERAEALVFRPGPVEPGVRRRLRMLDALQPIPDELMPLSSEDIAAELVPTREQLLALLADADTRVSSNAGRILAVSGDVRGIPAVCRWLQWNPRMTASAGKLMTALFGPDWRDLGESGSATREPGPGDGGR